VRALEELVAEQETHCPWDGCRELLPIKNIKGHRDACVHRPPRCGVHAYPSWIDGDVDSYCGWSSGLDILAHCKEKHGGVVELTEHSPDGSYTKELSINAMSEKNAGTVVMACHGETYFLSWETITNTGDDSSSTDILEFFVTSFLKGGAGFTMTANGSQYQQVFTSTTVWVPDHLKNYKATPHMSVYKEFGNADVLVRICFHPPSGGGVEGI
jgi:hypothetical protein